MEDLSTFESREGQLTCSPKEVYDFVTDIRNFQRFIPEGAAKNIKIEKDSCSFNVNLLGEVKINILGKTEYDKVVFSGNALHLNNFQLVMNIHSLPDEDASVNVILSAEMNPLLKMVAAGPVRQFLETLIKEMESFTDWKNIR